MGICSQCVRHLRVSYKFRTTVIRSQTTLKQQYHQINEIGERGNLFGAKSEGGSNTTSITENHLVDKLNEDCSNSNSGINNDADIAIMSCDSDNTDYCLTGVKSDIKCDVPDFFNSSDCEINTVEVKEETSCTQTSRKWTRKKSDNNRGKYTVQLTHQSEYKCEECNITFNQRWKLQKHASRIHSEEKTYICTYCNRAFKQSYHLREHLTSHTGERNYSCSFCGKTFQRISSQRRHVRSHEAAPGQKTKRTPFLCTICGKSFPFSNGVQRHMRIHLGIRKHQCTLCNRRFMQSTHLHVHMRTHTGEKPYICDTCGDAFSLNASLQKHMSIHRSLPKSNVLEDLSKVFLV